MGWGFYEVQVADYGEGEWTGWEVFFVGPDEVFEDEENGEEKCTVVEINFHGFKEMKL